MLCDYVMCYGLIDIFKLLSKIFGIYNIIDFLNFIILFISATLYTIASIVFLKRISFANKVLKNLKWIMDTDGKRFINSGNNAAKLFAYINKYTEWDGEVKYKDSVGYKKMIEDNITDEHLEKWRKSEEIWLERYHKDNAAFSRSIEKYNEFKHEHSIWNIIKSMINK